jgi:hypothetical protein
MDTLMRMPVFLRHCPNSQAREANQRSAHFVVGYEAVEMAGFY